MMTELTLKVAELERENEALRDALDFYAQPSNWRREVRNVGPRVNWWSPAAARDKGGVARMALLGLEGKA